MPDMDQMIEKLRGMPTGLVKFMEKWLRKLPAVRKEIDTQTEEIINDLESSVKPYEGKFSTYSSLPSEGRPQEDILSEIEEITLLEQSRWQGGYVSGAVYHGDREHIDFLNQVYALQSQSNPLHMDLFPSASKFESEIVSMTASMLGAGTKDECCGTVNSGGTESILLAMKTYRDLAYKEKNIRKPEIIIPESAHAAFDKAGEYFKIRVIRTPVDSDYKANVQAIRKAVSSRTIAIAASAVSFPNGVIDSIYDIAVIAEKQGIGFHVDACLGGFILPWAEKLGYDVPPFDFRVQGVTSISADTHKYGYAAKGSSVVLYRTKSLRRYQYFTATDWPGGLYLSPTLSGSRPGALSAACWAAMISMGEKGYLKAADKILKTGKYIRRGIDALNDLHVLGDPLWVISFASSSMDIYRILDFMSKRQWNLNGLHKPASIHICVTLRHTRPGVAEKFISDLTQAVDHVKNTPSEKGGMAPIYGMAATLPLRSVVNDLLERYLDLYYKVSQNDRKS